MVGLDGKDAGRICEVRLVGDQCCRTLPSTRMRGVTPRAQSLRTCSQHLVCMSVLTAVVGYSSGLE